MKMEPDQTQLPVTHLPTKMVSTARHKRRISSSENEDITSYKNQNVLFQIHSPKGSDNYNAKTFPAKFSINITNETNELSSGIYDACKYQNTERPSAYDKMRKSEANINLNEFAQKKRNGVGNKVDLSYYENALKEYKDEYDRLAQQSQQNCDRYEQQIKQLEMQLANALNKIDELENLMNETNDESKKSLYECTITKKQLEEIQKKLSHSELQIFTLKQKLRKSSRQIEHNERHQAILRNQIAELERAITQKQELIKQINRNNDDHHTQVMKQRERKVDSEVKMMEKWLKGFSKVMGNYQDSHKFDYQYKIRQILQKFQTYEQQKEALTVNAQKLNQCLIMKDINIEQLQKQIEKNVQYISDLQEENATLKEDNQHLHQRYLQSRNTVPNAFSEQFLLSCAGTVKVKMDLLLQEKDKHIRSLQSEVKGLQSVNINLNSQIHKLQYQLKSATQPPHLVRVRSESNYSNIGNFRQKGLPKNFNYFGQQFQDARQKKVEFMQTDRVRPSQTNFEDTYTYNRTQNQDNHHQKQIRYSQPNDKFKWQSNDYKIVQSQRSTNRQRRNVVDSMIGRTNKRLQIFGVDYKKSIK